MKKTVHRNPVLQVRLHLQQARETALLHPDTHKQLEYVLQYLKDYGQKKTFRMIRQKVLKDKPMDEWKE